MDKGKDQGHVLDQGTADLSFWIKETSVRVRGRLPMRARARLRVMSLHNTRYIVRTDETLFIGPNIRDFDLASFEHSFKAYFDRFKQGPGSRSER